MTQNAWVFEKRLAPSKRVKIRSAYPDLLNPDAGVTWTRVSGVVARRPDKITRRIQGY
jgi:hypothetical protein